MIGEILLLRIKQLYRAIATVGWLALFIIPFLIIILLGLFESAERGSYTLALLMTFLLGAIHFLRNDVDFLTQLTKQPAWIRTAEYVSIALVVAALQLALTGEFQNAKIFIPIALVLPWIPIPKYQTSKKWWLFPVSWVPIYFFEWRSGLRSSGWFWLLLFALCLFATPFSEEIPIPLIYLILFGISVSSWYDYLEPKEILDVEVSKGNFLLRKISKHLVLLLLVQSVPMLIGIFYWPNLWYLMVIGVLMTLFMLVFAILYKYANYNNDRVRLFNQLPTGIFNMAVIIPLLTFLCLVYLLVYWRKAIKNMNLRYA